MKLKELLKSDYVRNHYDEVWVTNVSGEKSRHIFNAGPDVDYYEVLLVTEQEGGEVKCEETSFPRDYGIELDDCYVEHCQQ